MKILVYGMQSSGASLFTYFLAQQENWIGIPDIHTHSWCPKADHLELDIVVKCVVTTDHPIEKHISIYKPDKTILFLRDRQANMSSLGRKGYKHHNGRMEDKFEILDQLGTNFDFVVQYEDFIKGDVDFQRIVPLLMFEQAIKFPRRKEEMRIFNMENFRWCKKNRGKKWGFGRIKFDVDGQTSLRHLSPIFL